jgi:hypothetical protein
MYLRPKVLGNFRERVPKKHENSDKIATRLGMSPEHLALIRQLPCCMCRKLGPNDPHHLKSGLSDERGGSIRATDRRAVPLCRFDHDTIERAGTRNERSTFAKFGIDPHLLATDLWTNTGDLEKMKRVLQAHWDAAKT